MTDRIARFLTKRRLRRWLVFASVVVFAWLACSIGVAYSLTRRPRPVFDEPAPEIAWGPFESHRIATSDGEELGAWYAEGRDGAPAVLILHGNKGSRRNSLRRAELLATGAGCSVLLVSLRAHGDSTGTFHDVGYSARRDVIASVDFLRARLHDRPILIHGVSMGAAAAVFAAADLGDSVQGYILESPFRDLVTAVRNRTKTYLPPVVDLIAFVGLRLAAPIVLPDFHAIAPIDAIASIPESVPVLILAGEADSLATPGEARELFEVVRTHAAIEVIPEAGHNNLPETDPYRYRMLLIKFCDLCANPMLP